MMSENMTSPMNTTTNSTVQSKEQQQKSNFSMTEIETSVSRLLMTTKRLLETLTAWSSGQVGDTQVYDEYNALEVHFASATQAFETALLPMEDMLHLPDDLYACLKETLSKEPCSITLEQHLPSIRDTILKLLQGLKKKQVLLREKLFDTNTSHLLFRAEQQQQQQQLSPLNISSIPLPSPSSSTEQPPLKQVTIATAPRSPLSPIETTTNEEFDMNDPSTKDAMNALCTQGNLAGRSSIRKKNKITFYLKKGVRVKKVNFDQSKLTIAVIHELFRTKFALDDIHQVTILDSESDVEYDLEDLTDIKPYSILSIQEPLTELEFNGEMKSLFKETMDKVLHTMQLNNHSTPNDNHKETVEELRQELTQVRKLHNDFKQEAETTIKELKEQCKRQQTIVLDTEIREEMNDNKEITTTATNLVTNKLEVLQDKIDQIKLDVTQKRCRPSKDQLNDCQKESDYIKKEVDTLSKNIKTLKPKWKKMWEIQLQEIVKEQQFLKEQESVMIDLKEDHTSLTQVLGQLLKISEIHERKKQSGISLFKVAPIEEGFEGMSSVIKQVSSIQVDHSKRVKALEEAEKSRSKELSQRIDVFEKELVDFVGLGKLKKTGGAKAIEKQRQEKHQDLIKQMYDETKLIPVPAAAAASVVDDQMIQNNKENPK